MALDLHTFGDELGQGASDNSARRRARWSTSPGRRHLTPSEVSRLKPSLVTCYQGARAPGAECFLGRRARLEGDGTDARDMDFIEAANGARATLPLRMACRRFARIRRRT